jgi:hypothetical protein
MNLEDKELYTRQSQKDSELDTLPRVDKVKGKAYKSRTN